MSNKKIGNFDILGPLTVQSKKVGLSVSVIDDSTTLYTPDTTGHVSLPIPSNTDVDSVLASFPLSQYGALNKSVGVAGTYDGGTTARYYSSMPVLLENDGTLVYLRPGTNGNTVNYYYTYVTNPNSNPIVPQSTIRKYYNGASTNILFYDSYAKDTLIYQEVDNSIVHVVLTNGTMDNANHQEATFNKSLIPVPIITALKVDTYVYIIGLYSSTSNVADPFAIANNLTDALQFAFYRIPVSQIIAGTISTVEQVTGIGGSTMYGDAVSASSYVKIADAWASNTSSSTKSFIKYADAIPIINIIAYGQIGIGKSYYDGTNIIFSFYTNGYGFNSSGRFDTMYGFSVTYNVAAKTYTTDLSSTPVSCAGGATGSLTWTNPYAVSSANIFGSGTAASDGISSSWYVTDAGVNYAVKEKYVLADNYNVAKGTLSGFTTKANAYKIRNRTFTAGTVYTPIYGDYASRVGDQLTGGSPISSTRIMFTGTGTYQGTTYTKFYRGISDIGTTRGYTYNSLDYGTTTGYSPQAFRVPFGAVNEPKMISKLSYCDASGVVSAYGTVFIENNTLSAGNKFDATALTYDTVLSTTNAVLQSVKSQILTSLSLTPTESTIGIYYSPLSTFCKSIACISTFNGGSAGGNIIMATVDCTLSGSNITAITLSNVFVNQFISNIVSGTNIAELPPKSGLGCVKYTDFTYISISHLIPIHTPGDTNEYTVAGVVNASTGNVTNAIFNNSYHATGIGSTGTREYSYLPNVGFGYYIYDKTDLGTKLIFNYCGNTLSQFTSNLSAGTGTNITVLAQDVVVGFYLYFTEITPVFMGGKYLELPITTIDLTTVKANPANTTFYAYVQYNTSTGLANYLVSTTQLTETVNNMYIGSLTTDSTKVSSLNINKVSKLDNYRPSTTNIGSAFPVSTGFPSSSGTINW